MIALIINTEKETKVIEVLTTNNAYNKAVKRMNEMEVDGDDRLGSSYDVVCYNTLEEAFNSLIKDNIEYAKEYKVI